MSRPHCSTHVGPRMCRLVLDRGSMAIAIGRLFQQAPGQSRWIVRQSDQGPNGDHVPRRQTRRPPRCQLRRRRQGAVLPAVRREPVSGRGHPAVRPPCLGHQPADVGVFGIAQDVAVGRHAPDITWNRTNGAGWPRRSCARAGPTASASSCAARWRHLLGLGFGPAGHVCGRARHSRGLQGHHRRGGGRTHPQGQRRAAGGAEPRAHDADGAARRVAGQLQGAPAHHPHPVRHDARYRPPVAVAAG